MIYRHITNYSALTAYWLVVSLTTFKHIHLLKDGPLPETYLSRSTPKTI